MAPAVILAADGVLLSGDAAGGALCGGAAARVLHRDNLDFLLLLGTGRNVVLRRFVLDKTPDTVHNFLLATADTQAVFLAKSVEDLLGAVAKVVTLLRIGRIVKLLGFLDTRSVLRRSVLDVLKQVTDATLDKLLEFVGKLVVKLVGLNELSDAGGDGRHL